MADKSENTGSAAANAESLSASERNRVLTNMSYLLKHQASDEQKHAWNQILPAVTGR